MNTLQLLDRPIAFHRCLVGLTGSVSGALLLSQAIYWQNREKNQDDGWWWKTAEQWEEETGLSRRELESARARCVTESLLDYEVKGQPAKGFYRVNLGGVQTRLAETAKLDCTKAPNKIGGNRQAPIYTETTPETTPERAEVEGVLPKGFPPTLEEAARMNMHVLCGKDFLTRVWMEAKSVGGVDYRGRPIHDWQTYLAREWARETSRANEVSSASTGNRAGKTLWALKQKLEAKERMAAKLNSLHESGRTLTKDQSSQLKQLRLEIDQIIQQISNA